MSRTSMAIYQVGSISNATLDFLIAYLLQYIIQISSNVIISADYTSSAEIEKLSKQPRIFVLHTV